MTSSMTRFWRLAIAVLAFILLLAACGIVDGDNSDTAVSMDSGGDGDDLAASDMPSDMAESDDGGDMAIAEQGADFSDSDFDDGDNMVAAGQSTNSGGDGVAVPEISPISIGRQIIYTAEIDIRVEDVLRATTEANEAIAAVGGFLFGQSTVAGSRPQTVLTYQGLPRGL